MNKGKFKLVSALTLFLVALIALSGAASAIDATIDFVKVDGDEVQQGTSSVLALDRANEVEIRVMITALSDLENVEVEAVMSGASHDDSVSETTDRVDIKAGRSRTFDLTLEFPQRMDRDTYKLRVRVQDRDSDTLEQTYEIEVETARHEVAIRDVDLDPAFGVEPGRSLRALVDIRNYGQKDEDDVKISFEIPDLGVSALPDYLDIESDEKKVSEELYVRIPKCAEPGVYMGLVTVEFDDGDEVATEEVSVEVLGVEDGACPAVAGSDNTPSTGGENKVIVTVGTQSQELALGSGGAIYPVTFTNAGSAAKTFVLDVLGADEWATVKVSPVNTVTVGDGETKSLYVYVSAKESAATGERMFSVEVKDSNGDLIQQIPFTAVVVESEEAPTSGWSSVKKGLEVGLIVLVVLLVILGLIVAFNKMKGDDDDLEGEEGDEISGQTYY